MNSNETISLALRTRVPILSWEIYESITTVTAFVQIAFSLLGVVTNIINIRVFVEQGVSKTTTNIGLCSLSVFDLFNCTFMMGTQMCFIFNFVLGYAPISIRCSAFTTHAVHLAIVCYNSSSWTTVYLSIERSLCVLIPLKVKLIVRPKVTKVVVISIFLFFSTAQFIYSAGTTVVWRHVPMFNQTLPYSIPGPFSLNYLRYSGLVLYTIMSSLAIFIVAITTTIMIRRLHTVRKWRHSNTGKRNNKQSEAPQTSSSTNPEKSSDTKKDTDNKNNMSSKDLEMMKSVTTATCIFLTCLSVSHIPATATLVIPGATVSGFNNNLYFLGYQLRFLFSMVNSSLNFFFYVRVSSQFQAALASLASRNKMMPCCCRTVAKRS